MTNNNIRIAILDDHQMVVQGLFLLLENEASISPVGFGNTGEQLMDLLEREHVDVLIIDINLKGETAFDLLPKIQRRYPDLKVIALSTHNEPSIIKRMLKAGVNGYVLKDADRAQLALAIQTVAAGNTFYSPDVQDSVMQALSGHPPSKYASIPKISRREREVLQLIIDEKTTSEIAAALFISPGTVETHRRNLLSKLGARNTAGLVRIAMENGLLEGHQ